MATFTGTTGSDTITPGLVTAGVVTVPGGAQPSNAADIIDAGAGDDIIDSGGGNDTVRGQQGNDIMFLGAGSDRAIWNPGDGSDTIEGQGQTDTLEFNGSAASENFVLSANGARALLSRDVGSVTMDLNDLELLVLNAGIGSNSFLVGNMTGTDLVGPIAFVGGNQVDTVDASAAFNDMIVTGGGAADSLVGGHGDDVFRYFAGSDAAAGEAVHGGGGVSDTLQLTNTDAINFAASTLSGLERLQFVSGNSSATFAGNQLGGSGIERVSGGIGNDAVIARGDAIDLSTLLFSAWNDATDKITLVGTVAVSELTGSVRNDVLNGGGGADVMAGGAGNDVYFADNAGDKAIEEASGGNDSVFASVSYAIAAGQHVETVATTSVAGTGVINLTGNELAQRINGNNGANAINGGGGNDILFGHGSNDSLNGGTGADQMAGGLGNDVLYVDNAGDKVFEAASQGAVSVFTSVGYALAAGQHVETLATTSIAGTGAINLTGNELAQRINGNNANNDIAGAAGNDVLVGYGGNDWLRGGAGNDSLIGGAGLDSFVFDTVLNPATNVDRITDFSVPQDTVRLDNAVMAGLGATLGTLSAAKFWKSTAGVAHDADDRVIYDIDSGRLFYDSNGNAAGGAVHFATLAPNLALNNADFVVF